MVDDSQPRWLKAAYFRAYSRITVPLMGLETVSDAEPGVRSVRSFAASSSSSSSPPGSASYIFNFVPGVLIPRPFQNLAAFVVPCDEKKEVTLPKKEKKKKNDFDEIEEQKSWENRGWKEKNYFSANYARSTILEDQERFSSRGRHKLDQTPSSLRSATRENPSASYDHVYILDTR